MSIPYRTRRNLNRLGTFLLVMVLLGTIGWFCWVVWLQRYVVYTDDGAKLDFSRSANDASGIAPKPPEINSNISIYYNEGANAVDTEKKMTKLSGYYITNQMVKNDLDDVLLQVERLPAGTPVMIEMKGPFGSFFYESKLNSAVMSESTDMSVMASLVDRLQTKGFYTIAQVSAFRDRNFAEGSVSSRLCQIGRPGIAWVDPDNMYWIDPSNATVTTWITSVVLELKEMGFNEVMLADFCFPNTDEIDFSGDRTAALQEAAQKLMNSCGSENFTLSFCVEDIAFVLPEGRCRMYLKNVNAAQVDATAAKVSFEDPEVRLVFLSETGDTRYDGYSVLRSMSVAEEVEARKEDQGQPEG